MLACRALLVFVGEREGLTVSEDVVRYQIRILGSDCFFWSLPSCKIKLEFNTDGMTGNGTVTRLMLEWSCLLQI